MKEQEKFLSPTYTLGFVEGRKEREKEILEIIDEWYKGWRKDKIQEFWIDDLKELKQKIKENKQLKQEQKE